MRRFSLFFSFMAFLALFAGCSAQQVNETTDSIISDVQHFGNKVTEQH